MQLAEIIEAIENFAPPCLQESYDNAGLITGDVQWEITGALLCLDSTETVIEEAIQKDCNLVIAHHPIVFSGLKSLTGENHIERTIIKAIKNDIAIYAAHTNLDNVRQGVNQIIAEKLGLQNAKILAQKSGNLCKLFTFCPEEQAGIVRDALFAEGAGTIGAYENCSFTTKGNGTFLAGEKTNPVTGKKGELNMEPETKIEVVFPAHLQHKIVDALINAHPYEEVAYDIIPLLNSDANIGSGLVGDLIEPMDETGFLHRVKEVFKQASIRYTKLLGSKIKKVTVCGGSGTFLLKNAIAAKADVFITADFKYHQFFDADGKIVVADIGHYESEQFTPELFHHILKKKFPTFALHFSKTNTNPINYV